MDGMDLILVDQKYGLLDTNNYIVFYANKKTILYFIKQIF